MKSTNPLPGMNPYLEVRWPDAHTALIGYIRDTLNEQLPQDLSIVAEESVTIDTIDGDSSSLRADVAVIQDAGLRLPDVDETHADESATLTLAKPETITAPTTHRWLEIRDTLDHLVTVIEILSPSNKTLSGAAKFADRQERLLASGVNILDIDLIRGGTRAVPHTFVSMLKTSLTQTQYLIVSGRGGELSQRQVYYCPLTQRLPAVAVPLRRTDADAPLDLQPLIDRCYANGRYWQVSQRPLPDPPLHDDELAWLDALRTQAGLI